MVVVEVGRYGWSKLDQIGRWLVHGRLIVAMVRPSERGTGWASVGEPRDGPASCPPPREVGPQVDTRPRKARTIDWFHDILCFANFRYITGELR